MSDTPICLIRDALGTALAALAKLNGAHHDEQHHDALSKLSKCQGSRCAWWRPVPPQLRPDGRPDMTGHGSCALFEGAQRFRDPAAPPEGGDHGAD